MIEQNIKGKFLVQPTSLKTSGKYRVEFDDNKIIEFSDIDTALTSIIALEHVTERKLITIFCGDTPIYRN